MLLLRLRQACVHFHITKSGVDEDAFKMTGADDDVDMDEIDELMERTMANLTIADPDDEENAKPEEKLRATNIFEPTYLSCKMKKTLELLKEIMEKKEKV